MENNEVEKSLEGKEEATSHADLVEERTGLQERLHWTRLQLQHTLALSADADETISNLAAAARGMMKERDEVRNQWEMLVAEFQARNAQMMLAGRASSSRIARPDAFAITGYNNRALAPPVAARPFTGTTMHEQYGQSGVSYCFASSSDPGHMSLASSLSYPAEPAFHDFASSSQDAFDPDMFLVDAVESPQDFAPATASPDLAKNSGAFDPVAEQVPQPRQGVRDAGAGPLLQSAMDAGAVKVRPSFTGETLEGSGV